MPPQTGMFAVPHGRARAGNYAADVDMSHPYQHHRHPHNSVAGPSSRLHDDGKRDRRRKEIAGRVGREMHDRRDDARQYNENITNLHNIAVQLSARPESYPLYELRLYPLSLERSAILSQLEMEEKYALDCAQTAYDEEKERVEDEWKRGREKVRERLLEGIEERRRRAREEKDGEGTAGDAALDSHSRPPITRKLRNKMGSSPPPTPLGAGGATLPNGTSGLISSLPITTGPFPNPHSLAVDELPSPFPLPLTATTIPNGGNASNAGTGNNTGGRRRAKGGGVQGHMIGGLGKSLAMLSGCREAEIENDLGEIRRGNKRRRAVASTLSAKV